MRKIPCQIIYLPNFLLHQTLCIFNCPFNPPCCSYFAETWYTSFLTPRSQKTGWSKDPPRVQSQSLTRSSSFSLVPQAKKKFGVHRPPGLMQSFYSIRTRGEGVVKGGVFALLNIKGHVFCCKSNQA